MMETKNYYVYILRCLDNTLYTGVAVDPWARLEAHNSGLGAKYTRSRRPCKLVYLEEASNRSEAQKREWAIKHLTRPEKLALIKSYKKSCPEGS